MKLLKEAQKTLKQQKKFFRIAESAAGGATGAGSVAGAHGSLFGEIVRRAPKKTEPKRTKRSASIGKKKLREYVGEDKFNSVDVISKLKNAEKKAQQDDDAVAFGLEDEDGNIVRVYVKAEQADEFEKALSGMLSGQDEDSDKDELGDESYNALEIAELLFKLKDRFEIVDVDWGSIPEDQEEEEPGMEPGEGAEGEGGMLPSEGGEGEGELPPKGEGGEGEGPDMEAGASLGGDEGATSALQQVIDVLKAEAEARKAEAEARRAEAKAKESEYVAQAAAHKVKQEEQVLDMEAYYKNKKEKDKEAQTLAKLAKYQHDLASDQEADLSGEDLEGGEEGGGEEGAFPPEEQEEVVTRVQLGKLLHKLLRAQH